MLSSSMRLGREHTRVGDTKLGLGHIAGGCLCSSISVEVLRRETYAEKTELGNYSVDGRSCVLYMDASGQPASGDKPEEEELQSPE